MADIIHRVGVKAPVSQVYAALATVQGVAGWWTRETSGESEPNGKFNVLFRSPTGERIGGMEFEVLEHSRDRAVRWRCTAGPEEWLGTEVTFHLSESKGDTIVLFGHRNWREVVEFTAHCSMKWAMFMLSLKDLVETGQGKPAPDDVKIDDYN